MNIQPNPALELWNTFRNYLQVSVDWNDADNLKDSKTPVPVAIILLNNAPVSPDYPRVVFEDIRVEAEAARRSADYRPSKLNPGERLELTFLASDPAKVHIEVSASVSRQDFMTITKLCFGPPEKVRPVVETWLSSFDAFDLQTRLTTLLDTLPEVTGDMTLSQLKSYRGPRKPALTYSRTTMPMWATWNSYARRMLRVQS